MEKPVMAKVEKVNKGPTIGARHIQFLFLALLGFLVYSTRFGFSVSLVAMTENYSPNPDIPYYNWKNKSLILSMFFWGYTLPQIAIGILSTKFGTKPFLLIALFMNSLCMFLIPTIAEHFGSQGVMACRLLQGFAQGLVVPCVHGGIGKWAPPNERSRVYAFLSTGYMLGIAVGTGTTGFICASWAGWPLTFYLLPSLGFLWVIMYYFFGATSPATHKTITEAEQNYLQISLKSQDIYNVSIPYRAMFTSSPFWAQLIMALCSGWGYSIFTTEMPIYMDKVMKFDIKSNGVISALPPIFVLLAINATAIVTDYLIKHDCLTLTNTRKLMSSIGSFGCAALMLIFVYIPNDSKILCVVIMIAANVLRSINAGGFNINHLDYAPNFAAAVMGIINTCAECFSFITPMAIQYIVYDESDISLWRTVFFTAICLYVFSTCFYLVFASGEAQPWNNSPVRPDVENSNTKEKSDAEIKLLS
ncbi:unnamed protein product [Psylliodes chrysocephalus]|uniref:Major facilitator superfamily (MFS) profile domain-containing protein n=2 Tax=Psylliodes chrysocephalus TaxID=3402493 RepID=A0A9P0GBH3_9CUCU|nr:unnamed protein product [Psylliodes chrysocephala]